jgi:hypothetical protein
MCQRRPWVLANERDLDGGAGPTERVGAADRYSPALTADALSWAPTRVARARPRESSSFRVGTTVAEPSCMLLFLALSSVAVTGIIFFSTCMIAGARVR